MSRSRRLGFSLVELLVAMTVLAVLAAVSFGGLTSVLEAEARVRAEAQRWSDVAVLMAQLEQDLALAVGRTVRDGAGSARPALIVRATAAHGSVEGDGELVITRLGDDGESFSRSGPRRIAYRFRAGNLEYLVWPAVDSAPGTGPAAHPALQGIAGLQVSALDQEGAWWQAWPAAGSGVALPRAVAVEITLPDGARVRRVFALR
jgi:general secretion pathway protein J